MGNRLSAIILLVLISISCGDYQRERDIDALQNGNVYKVRIYFPASNWDDKFNGYCVDFLPIEGGYVLDFGNGSTETIYFDNDMTTSVKVWDLERRIKFHIY